MRRRHRWRDLTLRGSDLRLYSHPHPIDSHCSYPFGAQAQHLHRLCLRADDPALFDANMAIVVNFCSTCTVRFVLGDNFDRDIGSHLDHGLIQEIFQITDIIPTAQEDEEIRLPGAQEVGSANTLR
jgi:hypothetical protein